MRLPFLSETCSSNFKKNFFSYIVSFLLLFSFLLPSFVFAQNLSDWETVLNTTAGSQGAGYNLENAEIEPTIARVIRIALSILGVLFLILMVWGGFLWMTARGNDQQVSTAKALITAAVIGLIIVLASYAISAFVVRELTQETLRF